jgi:xanthosine utilization system XapX-like protein
MIRAAQTKFRPAEGDQMARGVPVVQVVRALNSARPVAIAWPSPDWAAVREGVREVLLTLAATLAIGFAWAAIEVGWTDPGLAPAEASGIENRYDGELMAGR